MNMKQLSAMISHDHTPRVELLIASACATAHACEVSARCMGVLHAYARTHTHTHRTNPVCMSMVVSSK